jgi:hypothetical protein
VAKGIYFGVADLARKGKKAYIGVGNVARKIKKIYIGVANVARLAWSGELSYFGIATPLSVGRSRLAATSIGDYAIFAGGEPSGGNSYSNVVDAYTS